MMQNFLTWVTEGVTFGNVAALILVLIIFRDRIFGNVSLTKLDKEFRDAEDSHAKAADANESAHRALNDKIGAVREDTSYIRGVLDTIKDRIPSPS